MSVSSLLDTDLYKLTMQQAVWRRFPEASAEYAFRCRTPGIDLRPLAEEIRAEIDALGALTLHEAEAKYLAGLRYLSSAYIDFLRGFRFDPTQVTIRTEPDFSLRIAGPWQETILFEVPVLAIVNAVYFRRNHPETPALRAEGLRRLETKCAQIAGSPVPLRLVEFGTRRRYSGPWQQTVAETLQRRVGAALAGTSNVALARTLGLTPIGTMAHEFLQAGQAMTHPLDAQRLMLETWLEFYRGDLGIALSDVFGMEAFLADFDGHLARAYDGARHDSGDPSVWGERLIAHYEGLGIDPRTKTAVFSDGLDIPRAIALAERFEGRVRTVFGIGTNLTNDLGAMPLSIVVKMVRCNGRPVVKLSDSPGKEMTEDDAYLAYLRRALERVSK